MKNIKNIYLILVVIFSILAVTLLSTKALFVNVTENNNSVTLETGLSYKFNVNANQQFKVPANTSVMFDALVTNDVNDGSIYYELYYSMISPTTKPSGVTVAEISDGNLSTSGNLELNGSKKVSLIIKNESSEEVTIKIGLSAGYVGNAITYTGNETLITDKIATSEAPEETWSGGGTSVVPEGCVATTAIEKINGITQVVERVSCPTVTENADTTGASMPELFDGMIPIKWNSNNEVVKADMTNPTSDVWYNYFEKQWANAVMVTSATRETYMNAEPGTAITESDILAYWVWVPRYRYKLFNATFESGTAPQTIEIEFESASTEKSTGMIDDVYTNGQWFTHPAFTFGSTELNGFWIGKFESSGTASAGSLKVVPGVASLKNQTLGVQYATAKLFANTTYLEEQGVNEIDAHMLKNIEWGAVALLSHSIYGTNQEITKNSSISYTGGGVGNTYVTNYDQSTTGTVYGVYDMSGGLLEYVMGNYNQAKGSSGLTVTTEMAGKYVDIYIGSTVASSHMGDATGETAAWYEDQTYFVSSAYPWFLRGDYANNGSIVGIFSFRHTTGVSADNISFRSVLTAK